MLEAGSGNPGSEMKIRYDIGGLTEAQFEPGSGGRVLKNLMGIRRKRDMDRIEASRLAVTIDWAISEYGVDRRFTDGDICQLHRH